jgi:hypothetical protein
MMQLKKILFLLLSIWAFSALGQDLSKWGSYNVLIKDESASNTLPVTALGTDSWPNYYSHTPRDAKAWHSFLLEMNAEHESGWQFGGVLRSEASVTASSGMVDAMALAAQKSDPSGQTSFALKAKTKSWDGRGLQVKSPWQILDQSQTWSGRVQIQWLQLTKLREASGSGVINFSPTTGYTSDLNYNKNYSSTRNVFLSPPDSTGVGGSMSLFLRKDLKNQDYIDLEVWDAVSRLQWNMVGENAGLKLLPSDALPHGVQGRQYNTASSQRMDATYKARWGQSFQETNSFLDKGRWLVELERRSDLHQTWFGWSTKNFSYDQTKSTPTWGASVTHDVVLGATKIAVTNSSWYAQYATDKLSKEAHIRSMQLGWRSNF